MKSLEAKIKGTVPTLVVFQHVNEPDAENVNSLLNELRAQYGERVNIESINASHNGNIKVSYKIKEYPTWILYKEGEELMRESGHKTVAHLTDMIQRAL